MDVNDVPQEGNCTLGSHRKALYAKDAEGMMVIVPSRGSEVDETVTMQAVHRMNALAEEAKTRVLAGQSAPLEYWMCARRMDVALLSQISGIWQWRIRRHFNPQRFSQLSPRLLARYAEALGLTTAQLQTRP
ncbi:conserved hypothetical protein [Rhodoferax ferrireducens T118]|uniref:Uncharacterized protein n=1 Tax=Albidiferax ferrireducens (strain ATCC BAA-621 / DSM 15236 / T118) TaxID=338969 RepID=Q21RD2_ALBFT|nr:hypothetical protein [Rhodoferax ferrireducens]ABD71671.1 conserved hypothetical protein [Rhodoferax ferrireducens T118]